MAAEGGGPLLAVLDRLHAAVMRGDLASLAVLAAEVEAQLPDGAAPVPLPQPAAERLRHAALRNAACLEAAARGVRAARRRLEETRAAAQGLRTYDMAGRPQMVATAAAAVARRV